jgi:hypothetical protein
LVGLLCWRATEQPDRLAYTFLADGENQEIRLTYGEDAQPAVALTTSQVLSRILPLFASTSNLTSMRWLAFEGEAIGAEDEWREPFLTS